jgi:hypothetical protein
MAFSQAAWDVLFDKTTFRIIAPLLPPNDRTPPSSHRTLMSHAVKEFSSESEWVPATHPQQIGPLRCEVAVDQLWRLTTGS